MFKNVTAYLRAAAGAGLLLLVASGVYLVGYENGQSAIVSSLRIIFDRSPTRHTFYRCEPVPSAPGFDACVISDGE